MMVLRRCAALCVLALAWAASPPGVAEELPSAERAALEQRVAERWAAQSAKAFGTVWEYSTPSFRAAFPKALYVHKFSHGVEWELTGVEVTHYDPGAAVASVTVRVMTWSTRPTTTASIEIGKQDVVIREKWTKSRGEWWHVTNF